MYLVLALLSALPLLVAGQVIRINVTQGAELQAQGLRQARSSVPIPAMRGAILDRAGRALAINTARYDLALDPTIDGFRQQAASFYQKLAGVTGRSAQHYRREVQQRSSPKYVLLEHFLTEPQQETIESWDVPGLILTPRFARRYNYGATAAHVLGYVSSDGHGLAGLELRYDEYLHGAPGRRAVKRNRYGEIKAFVGGQLVEPQHGQNLVLTIDLVRQTIVEEELARGVRRTGARWGTAIAMDPHTGAILSMANVPTYNPNRPRAYAIEARRNHAITDRIEPGSTFKLVTAAAAVEQGVVRMGDSIETGDGWMVVHGYTLQDTHAHGTISFAEAISLSSNIGIAKTAQRIDPGVFYQYARNLGFGLPTMIDLPGEVGGRLKRPAGWSGTSQTAMAIGYEVSVTPLQLLTAYAALANGGLLMKPYVVAERRDMTGRTIWTNEPDSIRRAFERETARRLLPAFIEVVENGTAEQAQVEGLLVAGKTGTAQKYVSPGGYASGAYRSTFVGFYPARAAEVAMIVVLDEPQTSIYGGATAAPVFRRITERWAGTLPEVARHIAAARDTTYGASGEEQSVLYASATPPAPSRWQRAPVADTTAMPDLRGLSAREAVFQLARYGVTARVRGHGVVTAQHPAPGASLPEQAVLRFE